MSLPKPNLDDKTFKELANESKNLIPIYAPEWTDYNASDPGITLIELFAWLTEMQLYRLNRVTEVNKLKFLKLLKIKPMPAKCAKTDVTFSITDKNPILIPKGAKLAAKDMNTNENIVFETIGDINVVPVKLEKIITRDEQGFIDNTQANELDGHYFSAFGNSALENNMLYIGFRGSFKRKKIELMVYLYEDDLVKRGEHGEEKPDIIPSAELKWEYLKKRKTGCEWIDLKVKRDETHAFNCSGLISLEPISTAECNLPSFEGDEYKLKWIRCKIAKKGHEIPPRIDSIKLNTIPVIQGEIIGEEIHSGDEIVDKSFFLKYKPVIAGSQKLAIKTPKKTKKETFSISEDKNWKTWKEVDDLDASGPEDYHYVIDYESGRISFGNGLNGFIPPKGKNNIKVTYHFGGGENGNVKEGAINQIIDIEKIRKANETQSGDFKMPEVINEQSAMGGKRKETLEESIIRARKDLEEPYQAVTSKDYEYIAKSTPGLRVRRVKAIADKQKGIVTVVIVPEGNPEEPNPKPIPSEGFLKTVCKHLDKHRLITTQVRVKKPEYTEVALNAVIRVKEGYNLNNVKNRVENRLNKFLNPLIGGSTGNGWSFGRNVFQSEIYEILDEVEGVNCIQEVTVADRRYKYDWNEIQVSEDSLVCSGSHDIKIMGPKEKCQRGWSL